MARQGEIIDGKYEVLREIGRGGMSIVYLAMDRRLNKQWAIKEFRKDKDDANKQVALKALLDEAHLMKKFDHPTLPRIVDIIEQSSTVYVVMDYIEGESLNKVLDAYGAQPQEAVIEWAKQLSEVLDYLHTQNPPVIYRDMKPANIMLKPDNTVRLIDFGIAREYKQGQEGDTEWIGTRGYAAPEQFGGKGQTDARTDIYSLGVTLYHLVTGKNPSEPPYEIYPIRHWNSSLSSGLEWMIQKCTQLNPEDRYQSCAEITYVLDNLDKFEVEYKKKLKSKINIFIVSVVLTIVFAIASVGCFVGSSTISKNTYQSLIAQDNISGYEQAIEQDEDNPEAYVGMARLIRNRVSTIYAQKPEDVELTEQDVLEDELLKWFSDSRLSGIKDEYPEEYAEVCYELGKKYWDGYESASGSITEQMLKAESYFKKVLEVAESDDVDGTVGLGEQKFTLAKTYYLTAFFATRKSNLSPDDGQFTIDEKDDVAEKYIYGIEDGTLENPYYSFWVTNKELLNSMNDENQEINDQVKIQTLNKIVYILQENESQFYSETRNKDESVDGTEMKEFVNQIVEVLDSITDSNYEDQIKEVKARLNNVILNINAAGKYGVELEEVK